MKTFKCFWIGTVLGGALALAGCGSDGTECGAGTVEVDGECVPGADACGDGTTFNEATGECEGVSCAPGTTLVGDECVPDGSVICGEGTTYNETTGECDPDIVACGEGTVLDMATGECVDPAELWDPDVSEPAEPNGFEDVPGTFDTPAEGSSVTLGGCITPTDFDGDGVTDADLDVFVFTATGPTLLDITVQGTGGLSGGFLLLSGDEQLDADGWIRIAANLVDETAQRQVYLPKAGVYALAISDGRSIVNGLAAGNPDACYLTTVENVAIPSPMAMSGSSVGSEFERDVLFYSYAPAEGDILFNTLTATSSAALGDFVQVVGGAYRGSGGSDRDFGTDAFALIEGLAASDTVVFAIDPVANLSLDPVAFTLEVFAPVTGALPTAGTITVDNDELFYRWLYFDAQAGDVLAIDLATDGDQLDVMIVGPGLTPFSQPCTQSFPCSTLDDSFFQLPVSGRYYVRLFDLEMFSDPPPASFELTVNHELITPAALPATVTGAALGSRGVSFYEFDASTAMWVGFTGNPTNFDGDMDVLVFDRTASGQLIDEVSPVDTLTFTTGGGEEYGRVLAGDDGVYLIGVADFGTPTGTGTFDLAVTDRTYTDLGAAPVDMTALTSTADTTQLYLVQASAGETLTILATPTGGFDTSLEVYDKRENATVIDAGGADEAETHASFGSDGYIAFGVVNGTGSDQMFDLNITTGAPYRFATAPGVAIPDDDPAGVTDTLSIPTSCVITSIQVEVDISHTWIGDITLELTSPAATSVLLHDGTGGSANDIVGIYPDTLTPAESLDAFLTENAMGDWELFASDSFFGDTGTINEWAVIVDCE